MSPRETLIAETREWLDRAVDREDRSLRTFEKMGWQAKAPAPQWCKPLPGNVGHALSPVNTAIPANITASQRVGLHQ